MENLNDKQIKAIEHIISGLTDAETAEKVGVTRETVNTWKNQNPYFKAELNKHRNSILMTLQDKQRELVTKAYKVLDKHLDKQLESDEIDVKTSLEIIRNYKPINPKLDTDPEIIEAKERKEKEFDALFF